MSEEQKSRRGYSLEDNYPGTASSIDFILAQGTAERNRQIAEKKANVTQAVFDNIAKRMLGGKKA